jgi:type IV pilus assembly protein PilQ
MSKRLALCVTVLGSLAAMALLAADASPGALNTVRDLSSKVQGGSVVVSVTGTYPILDYTYYDYDPETFVVDMADVDVSQVPKELNVNSGGVGVVKVEPLSQGRGRSLAKLEIHKGYLSKCFVSTEGNQLMVKVIPAGSAPGPDVAPTKVAPPPAPAQTAAAQASAPEQAPAPARPAAEATRLLGLFVAQDGSAVNLKLDGAARYKYFTVKNPERIVLDLYGVGRGNIPSTTPGAGDVGQVRVSVFTAQPLVTRVVLDMKSSSPFEVAGEGGDLAIRLGSAPQAQVADNKEPEPAPAAHASAPAGEPASLSASAAQAPKAESAPAPQGPATSPAEAPVAQASANPASEAVLAPKAEAPKEGLDKVKVNLSPINPDSSREFKGYEDLFVAQDTSAQAAEGKTLIAGGVPLSFKEKTISGGGVKYSGEPISLSLKDADIKDVLRVFHDISKMNIVVHPSVSGKVTVDLENVPWDQAMDIILKNNGLDYVYENNVIWVAPAAAIQVKFAEQQRMQQQRLQAEEPITFTKRLSYAKANNMMSVASRFLSEKGSIVVDDRTNTLIIQEVPSKKDSLVKLIDSLDTATPQVLIEARIVETNITWDQSFGITWSGNWYTGMDNSGKVVTTKGGTQGTGGSNTYALHNFNNSSGWPQYGQGDFAVTLPPSASNGFIDLVLGNTTGSFFLDVRLAAMENAGRGRVLSAPRIVTQDNEKASIESGRQIPIRIATTDKISVVFVNATLKLDVTPQISADGNVNMTVDITNDSVDFAHQDPGSPPPIIKKEAKTVLKVKDGATTVIGGVFVTNEGVSQSGLPFFSKIPVLGWLFKNRTKTRSNEELLIFLTPKIVR